MSAFHRSAFLSVGFDPSIVIRAIVMSGCNYCVSAKCLEAAVSSVRGAGRSPCLAFRAAGCRNCESLEMQLRKAKKHLTCSGLHVGAAAGEGWLGTFSPCVSSSRNEKQEEPGWSNYHCSQKPGKDKSVGKEMLLPFGGFVV